VEEKEEVVCCEDRFDRDELGVDPEEDEETCPVCFELVEDCECEQEEED
jgi:hypothetical protein